MAHILAGYAFVLSPIAYSAAVVAYAKHVWRKS